MKKEKGITLVSLAVTIIVIIIISSITISVTFGENGIIKKAGLTKDLASNFIEEENGDMNRVLSEYANAMGGNGGGQIPDLGEDKTPPTVNIQVLAVTEGSIQIMVTASDSGSGLAANDTYKYYINNSLKKTSTINSYTFDGLTADTQYTIKVEAFDEAGNRGEAIITANTKKKETIGDLIGGDKVENNTEIEDDLGNKVWIPGGFGLAEDSATKVEGGIVIQDGPGNQFVWIPIKTYKTTKGEKTNKLSRRTFTSSRAEEISGDNYISPRYYGEGDSRSVAKDTIEKFKTSATKKSGFYIGRYEAGTETERTSTKDALTVPLVQANKYAYMYVERSQAKQQAEAMYSGNSYVKSELISSYAWDTALNFMCQNSEYKYTLATTTSNQYGNINSNAYTKTGLYKVNGKESDKYSNIYDFLGNKMEWTTEYADASYNPCVRRGGYAGNYVYYASSRDSAGALPASDMDSFRIQLYVK